MKIFRQTIILFTATIAFLLCHIHAFGDTPAIDSLKHLLKTAKREEQKVDLLNKIAHLYSTIDEVKCTFYANQAIELAYKANYKTGIGDGHLMMAFSKEISNPDSAIYHFNKSLEFFNSSEKVDAVVQVYNNLGLIYKDKGEYQNALDHFFKAFSIVKSKAQLGMIYNNIGIVYRRSGSYDKAIDNFMKSLSIREELNDLNGLAITNGNLGNIYLNQKQYQKALEHYEKARDLFNRLDNPLFEAHVLQNMGIINTNIKEYEEAVNNFDQAIVIYQVNNLETGSANTYINKARIYSEMHNYSEALANNLNAIEILKRFNNKEYLTSAYIEAGKALLMLSRFDEAHQFFLTGLSLAKEIGNKQKEADGYEGLFKYYEEINKFPEALEFYKMYTLLKDSLFNEDVSKRMSAILSNVEIEKREKEKDLLEERIRRKELENKGLVGGAIFLSLFAIYFFNTTLQKKKTNKLLSAQNEEINKKQLQIITINESLQKSQQQLYRLNDKLQKLNVGLENTVKERTNELQKSHEELDTFLYQSSHALRRPIVNIMGLVQIARIEPEFGTVPNIYDKIEDTAARMDLMLKKLVMVSEINLSDQSMELLDFDELISDTITSLGPELLFKKIDIRKNIQYQDYKSDKRLISIILQNLVENAINFYDDCDGRHAFIEITVKGQNGLMELTVKDNGIGIPKELVDQVFDMFYVATTRSKGYGLGLYIVKKAVEKLKGDINIFSKEHELTGITLTIPNQH